MILAKPYLQDFGVIKEELEGVEYMSDEANTEPEFTFPEVIVTATPLPLTLNQIWGDIIKPFTAIAPINSAFIDATISWEDIGNGYTLDYNSNGILWRVNAAGIPHPDDLDKFYEQQEIIQGYSDNLAEEVNMFLGTPVVGNNVNLSSSGSENATDGSILDEVSDKWREFETWREREKYLNAVEMTKRSLEIFHGITPDHPEYEDILAVAVKEYLRIQEETPALLMGAQGPITKFVYISRATNGVVQYAGITNILARRAAEHLRTKGIPIRKLMSDLSARDAHAVEQALIEIHGLGSKGGTLMNKINSIAKSNPEYGILIQRGYDLLKSIGYGG